MKKRRNLMERRRTVPERIFFALEFAILAIWSAFVIFMLAWALLNTGKTNVEFVNDSLALPTNFRFLENFKIAIEKLEYNGFGFFRLLFNSIWYSVGSTFLSTIVVCTTGYIIAQYDFPGRNIIFGFTVFTMIIPIYGAFSAMYKLIFQLGLNDSPLYLITASGGLGGNMLMTYGFFKAMPKDYRDSVYMDGGSDFVAYARVYLPMGKSLFTALFLLGFIGKWNDYETAILYFDKLPGLATGLYSFQQEIEHVANNPAYFVGVLIVMLPIVLLFVLFSDKIMGQIYSGGLKG